VAIGKKLLLVFLACSRVAVPHHWGPVLRFPAGNSPVRGWGWSQIFPYKDSYGANCIPIRDGGDGDGSRVPVPNPAEAFPNTVFFTSSPKGHVGLDKKVGALYLS
jgi:hypothetical protein